MTAPTRPRRGPAPPPADAERAALLDAGLAHLTQNNASELTIAAILERAGLGTRAFYRHFSSKDEFILAIWLRETEASVLRLRARTEQAPTGLDGVEQWVEERLRRVFAPQRDTSYEALWRNGFWLKNAYPNEFEAVSRPQIDVLAAAIDRGLEDRSIPTAEPDLDARTLNATLWMLAERHIKGGGLTEATARNQLDRIVHGLFRTTSTPPRRRRR